MRLRYDFLRWAEEWVLTWRGTGLAGKEAEAEAILEEARARLEELDRELRDSLERERAPDEEPSQGSRRTDPRGSENGAPAPGDRVR